MSRVVIYRCPLHKQIWSVCVDAGKIGTRVLGGKCCPKQYSQAQVAWPLTQRVRDDFIEEMDAALSGEGGDASD